jgi:hypothetical protein
MPARMSAGAHVGGKFVSERTARDADDLKPLGEKVRLIEMIERRQKLALGEVAGGAKDDEDAGVGDTLSALGELREILRPHCHLHGGHSRNTSSEEKQALALSY